MSHTRFKPDFSRLAFWIATAFLFFIIGGEFALHNWQPWKFYADGYKAAKSLIKQAKATRPDILEKSRYSGDGVVRYQETETFDGLTLMQGWFPEGLEIRLVDMYGKVVHRWPLDFFDIWNNPEHMPKNSLPATRYNTHSQGMWLQPDGSVIFNLAGLIKMDKCGGIQWKLAQVTHHSVTQDQDGSFWVPAQGDALGVSDDMLLSGVSRQQLINASGAYHDVVLHVSPDGRVLREISVLRALIDGGFDKELFDVSRIANSEPTHLNDVALVTAELANKIDGVDEGDLMVSLRELHMLAIMDRNTEKIKWHHAGPWIRQHDPDVTPDGNIEVFNNNIPYWEVNEGNPGPQSNIISLDPSSGMSTVVFPEDRDFAFYTDIMGSKQRLKKRKPACPGIKAGTNHRGGQRRKCRLGIYQTV